MNDPTQAFAGFDRADCPPLSVMARLRKETNLRWVGYYLRAPSQAASTWKGKHAALAAQGWGFAPIFVGRQITGPGARLPDTSGLASPLAQLDGENAALRMQEEGFPAGSFVYLDLENGPPFTAPLQTYVASWIDSVRAHGFGAGVYCSYLFARQVAALRPNLRIWVFHVPSTKPHFVDGKTFPTPPLSTSGYVYADMWQREDEARLTAFDNLACDLDVSRRADPSEPLPSMLNPLPNAPVSTASPAASPPSLTPVTGAAESVSPTPKPSFWARLWAWMRS